MATQDRDDNGQFEGKMRDQDILKAFDFEATAEDPYLTVSEVGDALATHWDIDVTDEAVRTRLEQMRDDDTIAKRRFGPGVAYRALVGPELSETTEAALEETTGELEAGETKSHKDVRLGPDGTQ
ncbi:helix-turn-helix domain-containing protein [Halorientalis marina]|jgi:hypothetical protein|uniref:helix-turn-helix domain-containing protein n=1 Tax=Halorientalis marina TaxID=2931976 RepID=UPI001FF3D11B|nr:helix-turn-helix domain-containing protein [Halorientalis marina]